MILHQLSARTAAARIAAGELRAQDLVRACLERIAALDPAIAAFVEVWPEHATAAAAAIDRARAAGKALGPLAGVPVAIKDNLLCQGRTAACGSRMLERFVAPYSATAVARLERLGAVLIGRTNMDEFGMGSSTEHSAFHPTHNPWATDRVPGGSSGGAAAAVAADLCPLALGSDTGGSVRQPASLCGVTGLKPTYGRISRSGLVAYASSLDCVGLIARSAEDLALALAIAGPDSADSTCSSEPAPDAAAALAERADLNGLTIGLPRELNGPGLEANVAGAVQQAVLVLRELGARILECSLPTVAHAVPTYYLIAAAEASSNLARYDGVRFGLRADGDGRVDSLYQESRSQGFGAEVQLRILLGTFALRAGYQDEVYGQATRVRTLLRQDFARAFASCDLLACPTSPVAAFPLGSKIDDPLAMYLCDALTVPPSLAGLPALSLPCGFGPVQQPVGQPPIGQPPIGQPPIGLLPIGLQLIAPPFRENLLLQAAHVYQQHTDWHRRRPLP